MTAALTKPLLNLMRSHLRDLLLTSFKNKTNKGYGASLKRGIEAAKGDFVVITDADGTYPSEEIPKTSKFTSRL